MHEITSVHVVEERGTDLNDLEEKQGLRVKAKGITL
jgi:hypothetical protein